MRPEPRSRDDGAVNRRGKLVALHHQVFLTIRNEVVSGRYHGDGSPQALPGEHELASRFRVSRATVRRALASLESDGLVVRRRGAGGRMSWAWTGQRATVVLVASKSPSSTQPGR